MKLAAGNPNLMKKQAMRVNRYATLGALPSALGDKNPPRYAKGGAVLMERTEDMAGPRTFNHMKDGQGAPLRVLLGREWRVAGVTRFGNARLVGRVGSGFRWAGPGVTRGLRMSRDEADGGRRWAEAHRASDVRVTRSRFPLLRLADGARWPSDDDLLRRLHEAARRRGRVVEIRSGQRTVEEQRVLWEAWVAFRDHGGPPANRAAPPDADAPHVRGVAADCGVILTSGYRSVGDDPGMRRELRASGLCLPVGGEPWHVQVGSEWEG